MQSHLFKLTPAALALLLSTASSQSLITSFRGDKSGDEFGKAMAAIGDINRDAVPDILVGAPGADSAYVISMADGKRIFTLTGGQAGELFGSSLCTPGDIDRDGFVDFLVGAPGNDRFNTDAGAAYLFSGKDGKRIDTLYGFFRNDNYGAVVAAAGDVDKDGVPDLLIGAPKHQSGSSNGGIAWVVSGKTRRVLFLSRDQAPLLGMDMAGGMDFDRDGYPDPVLGAPGFAYLLIYSGKTRRLMRTCKADKSKYGSLGGSLALFADLNADGFPDIAAGAPFGRFALSTRPGGLRVISGKDCSVLFEARGDSDLDHLGISIASLGDLNGDKVADVIAGADNGANSSNLRTGYVRLYSGKTGAVLATRYGANSGDKFGISTAGVNDANGDGIVDFVVGASGARNGAGEVFLYSGKTLSLTANRSSLSIAQGGQQILHMDAGMSMSRQAYIVLGSLSGTTPGFKIGNKRIPLNPDVYLSFLLGNPNGLILGSFGILDFQGKGRADFKLPTGLPSSLANTMLHHAFLAFDLRTISVGFVSNAASLLLTK